MLSQKSACVLTQGPNADTVAHPQPGITSMKRTLVSAAAICVLQGSAFTQASRDPFVGTFRGQSLVISLQRSGGSYAGVGTSSNGQYQLRAQRMGQILLGSYMDGGVPHAFQIAVQGDLMQFASEGANIMLQRQAGAVAGATPGGSTKGSARAGGGGRGSVAATPQDRQLTQLLLSSRWCAFSYSQTSG